MAIIEELFFFLYTGISRIENHSHYRSQGKEEGNMQEEPVRLRASARYALLSVAFRREQAFAGQTMSPDARFSLAAVTTGTGRLVVEGERYELRQGSVQLVERGRTLRLEAGADGLSYYLLGFEISEEGALAGGVHLPVGTLICTPFSQCLLLLDALYRQRETEDELEAFENQVRFGEMLLFLGKQNRSATYEARIRQEVQRTAEEMQDNYAFPYTVDQLASSAGTTRVKYTQLFKELTGQLPLEFLNGMRIEKAQQLLLLSQDKLVDIAQAVGYNDEYYFNRRFKQEVGVTPGQFRRRRRNSDRAFAPFLEDFLVALGMKPVVQFCDRIWGRQEYLGLHDVPGFELSAGDWDALASYRPELIILDAGYRRWNLERCRDVAPVFRLPSTAEDWRATLHAIAAVFGIQDRAAEAIKRYESKVEEARETLARALRGKWPSVAVLRISDLSVCLYGSRHFGYTGPVLYGDLGLREPELAGRLLPLGRGMAVELETLAGLDADHLFITFDKREGDGRQLLDSPAWQAIPAVRNGRVHEVDFFSWMNYGVLSHHRKIEDVLRVLV